MRGGTRASHPFLCSTSTVIIKTTLAGESSLTVRFVLLLLASQLPKKQHSPLRRQRQSCRCEKCRQSKVPEVGGRRKTWKFSRVLPGQTTQIQLNLPICFHSPIFLHLGQNCSAFTFVFGASIHQRGIEVSRRHGGQQLTGLAVTRKRQ